MPPMDHGFALAVLRIAQPHNGPFRAHQKRGIRIRLVQFVMGVFGNGDFEASGFQHSESREMSVVLPELLNPMILMACIRISCSKFFGSHVPDTKGLSGRVQIMTPAAGNAFLTFP